jgi:hypothetical protein
MVHADDPIGVRERQRLEQHGADDAEDGGVGADAESKGEERGPGERRRVAQRADGVSQVLQQLIDSAHRLVLLVATAPPDHA